MSLLKRLKADLLAARKNKDKELTTALSTLLSDAEKIGKDDRKAPGRETTDIEVVGLLKKLISSCVEFKGLVTDEAIKATKDAEIAFYIQYMPKQMDEDEIRNVIEGLGVTTLGAIMGHFKANHAGLYDGAVVKRIAEGV
jgi:uncharacterized protein YqeY